MFDRKVIRFLMSLYAAWIIVIYRPRKLIHLYTPPIRATEYSMLLDDEAVWTQERLRLAYGLRTWADVYDLAIRVLTWITASKADDWNAPSRRHPLTGQVDTAQLPQMNLEAWRRTA